MLFAASGTSTGPSHPHVGSDPIVSALVAIVVLLIGYRISKRVARTQGDDRYVKLLMLSLVLHLLCAPAQIWVVDHIYHGTADFTAYVNRGANVAYNFRSGSFSFANTGVHGVTEDNTVFIFSGIVQTIIGEDKLALFFAFTGVAFLGEVAFFRAFATTFPEVNPRRYALLLFFLPSLLFWTADISKETIMTLALGLAAYGAARILRRRPGGYRLLIPGLVLGTILRPNEVVLMLAGFAVAMLFRSRDLRKKLRGARRVFTFLFVACALGLGVYLTQKIFHTSGSLSDILNQVEKNNSNGKGAGFGSSFVGYSSNPIYYPKDVYTVMFDPLPITAHGKGELLAGLENTIIVVIILMSWRQLKCVVRASRVRPYVLMCAIYSALFLYAFAALGNLGLIYRERTLLLPFLLVLLAIPISDKGERKRFPWEKKLPKRRARRQSMTAGYRG